MAFLAEETDCQYQKLPKGGIIADHQPAMFKPTKRVLLWLEDVPRTIDLEDPNTKKEASLPKRSFEDGDSIWEVAAKRRRGYEMARSKVTKRQSKKDNRIIIDLTGDDDSALSGRRLHIKKRTRLDASGTHYRTTVKVLIDLTESDEE